MKKYLQIIAIVFALASLTACGPAKKDMPVDVSNSQSAFVVDLIGAADSGEKLSSAAYLLNKKVTAKRIFLHQQKISTGRWPWSFKWVPTTRVIKVDRRPIRLIWEGRDNPVLADRGIKVESRDSIGFTIGIDISAHVEEADSHIFLYSYPESRNLELVLNKSVKSLATEVLSREFARYDLEGKAAVYKKNKSGDYVIGEDGKRIVITEATPGGREQKGKIVETAKKHVIEFFAKRGVTIDSFGLVGGLEYDNEQIQTAINSNFQTALNIENEANIRKAQAEINARTIEEATAKNEAATIFEKAAQAEIARIDLKIREIDAESRMIWAKTWKGEFPANLMPENSSMIFSNGLK